MHGCDSCMCPSTESEEESGVSPEESEHPDTDKWSPQSARLWKVCLPATETYTCFDLTVCDTLIMFFHSVRLRWTWSSLAFASLQVPKTLTSTWLMTSLHQMMWPRGRQRSHPRRYDSTLRRKFNVSHCGNVCVFISRFFLNCVTLKKMFHISGHLCPNTVRKVHVQAR